MDAGKKVWAPDLKEGFVLGEITDFGTDVLTVQPLNGGKPIEAPYDAVYPSEEEGAKTVDDNCGLMFLNEATLLHNMRRRFMEDEVYTYTANILLAVNPYHSLDLYGPKQVQAYQGKSLGVLPPHVYAISDKAYRDMRNLGLSQGIIVSGESGAGKTESTKYILRYLTDSYGRGGEITDLEARILAANPLLESFGNAKTTRNNNSSRFGKFVELHFNKNALVVGAHVEHYLLEKSRVISQSEKERNYHVFYRICKGAPQSIRDALNVQPKVAEYRFMKSGLTDDVEGLDDVKDFAVMEKSMNDCAFLPAEKSNVLRITAAVLHIGNLTIAEGGDGASRVTSDIKGIAGLLGLEEATLSTALTTTTMVVGGNETKKGKNLKDAEFGRDALAKAIYSKLFDWIVRRVNKCFPFKSSENFIGVLDIAGFEYFQVNSFEQFCINYCNEKLQQFFNVRVLKDEQELYVKESIKFKEVEFVDNQDCIDLIEAKGNGILFLLDEESKLPKATDAGFTDKLHNAHKNHFRLQLPRKSKMSYYKSLRDNEGFIIRHFAGAVCYQTDGFIDKNNDALTADLYYLMDGSKDPFLRELFEPQEGEAKPQRGKISLISLGTKFKAALSLLMEKLNSTRSNFIRCIKPNQKMQPKIFTGGEILSQLQCAGMVSVLDLMQGGFPSRTMFKDLYDMYKGVLPKELSSLEPRTFCMALFKALGLNEDDFQFGVSRVFFRPGKFAEFDTIMKSDPENLVALVAKVVTWLVKQRWKKMAWACVSCLKFASKIRARAGAATIMQKVIRMHLVRSQFKPRYHGLREVKKYESNVASLKESIDKLPKNKDKFVKVADELQDEINKAMNVIKNQAEVDRALVKKLSDELQESCDKALASLKKEQEKQKLQEEQERLKKLQEEMERQRKEKEEEEARLLAMQNESLALKEMEAQRKKEEDDMEKQLEKLRMQQEKEESDKKLQAKKAQDTKALQQEAQREEQERRDQELAMRLAEDKDNPDDALSAEAKEAKAAGNLKRKTMKQRQVSGTAKQQALHKKHDLSNWKYADLRDTINTSCDIDLLEACREEFHKRLKVYHAWKMKNQKKEEEGRMPGLAAAADSRGAAPLAPRKTKKAAENPQRYFRIPFVRPGDANKAERKKGWWFAHFDGQWVVRQMELHPDKPPVLLVAGKDDMEMCELPLDETGLSRKRGAEILPREFDEEWKRNGGPTYVPVAPKKK